MDRTGRPCNELEKFFASANVRFAICVRIPPMAVDDAKNVLRNHVLSHPSLQFEISSQSKFVERRANVPIFQLTATNNHLDELLEDEMMTDSEAQQIRVSVLERDGTAIGVCMNVNHALCDGRLMCALVEELTKALHTSISPDTGDLHTEKSVPHEMGTVANTALGLAPAMRNAAPAFLPHVGPALSLNEIPELMRASGEPAASEVRETMAPATALSLRERLRTRGATFTGLWAACLQLALAEAYFRSNSARTSCVVSVSILVDLRPYVAATEYSSQMFGTVVVSARVTAPTDGADGMGTAEQCLALATSNSSDLRKRIQRGEAHRSAVALSEGRGDVADLTATIELSNLGVISEPGSGSPGNELSGGDVLVSQRYDDYEGMSVMVHSEKRSGYLRTCLGPGRDIRAQGAAVVSSRAMELATLTCT